MYHPDLLRNPESCPALVLNADDPLCLAMASRARAPGISRVPQAAGCPARDRVCAGPRLLASEIPAEYAEAF